MSCFSKWPNLRRGMEPLSLYSERRSSGSRWHLNPTNRVVPSSAALILGIKLVQESACHTARHTGKLCRGWLASSTAHFQETVHTHHLSTVLFDTNVLVVFIQSSTRKQWMGGCVQTCLHSAWTSSVYPSWAPGFSNKHLQYCWIILLFLGYRRVCLG